MTKKKRNNNNDNSKTNDESKIEKTKKNDINWRDIANLKTKSILSSSFSLSSVIFPFFSLHFHFFLFFMALLLCFAFSLLSLLRRFCIVFAFSTFLPLTFFYFQSIFPQICLSRESLGLSQIDYLALVYLFPLFNTISVSVFNSNFPFSFSRIVVVIYVFVNLLGSFE